MPNSHGPGALATIMVADGEVEQVALADIEALTVELTVELVGNVVLGDMIVELRARLVAEASRVADVLAEQLTEVLPVQLVALPAETIKEKLADERVDTLAKSEAETVSEDDDVVDNDKLTRLAEEEDET